MCCALNLFGFYKIFNWRTKAARRLCYSIFCIHMLLVYLFNKKILLLFIHNTCLSTEIKNRNRPKPNLLMPFFKPKIFFWEPLQTLVRADQSSACTATRCDTVCEKAHNSRLSVFVTATWLSMLTRESGPLCAKLCLRSSGILCLFFYDVIFYVNVEEIKY